MTDNKKLLHAKEAYDTLCTTINNIGWKCDRYDDELKIMLGVNGDDLPMGFLIIVDADRQLIRILSLLPFKMNPEKRVEGAIATCVINYAIPDGCFTYDIEEGHIMFKATSSFKESLVGEEMFKYLISLACFTVDRFNDQLEKLNNGDISITDFIEANT